MSSISHRINVNLPVMACVSLSLDAAGEWQVDEVEVFGITFFSGDVFDVVAEATLADENLNRTVYEAAA